MIRIAINGFGRIGRNFLRALLLDKEALKKIEIVAINIGPSAIEHVAHMFKYDSLMGTYQGSVAIEGSSLVVNGNRIQVLAQADPVLLDWNKLAIDWVVDCSGRFTKRADATKHIQAGAKHVLISAPAKDEDVTIIPGVNDNAFDAQKHLIVSLGSCTTNALLPMLKVMQETFGIENAMMTTTHAYTNSQVLLDLEGRDLRMARAAAINIIPTTTGAMKVVGKIMPEIADRIQGMAMRVPVAKVSLIDLTVITKKSITVAAINAAFTKAAQGSLKNILEVTAEQLVSSDFCGNDHSVIIDTLLTATAGDTMAKVFGWYDNEWGYSVRLKDFLVKNS
ncbi:MAG: type I glyceraldehyde-3-phosphate dehydrogenase [Candidatus Dependentiae bacterium]|nr:type I glyceraldehyde-3-phosphate dehydrogenase [Candidatus Dependentiae bacterium]